MVIYTNPTGLDTSTMVIFGPSDRPQGGFKIQTGQQTSFSILFCKEEVFVESLTLAQFSRWLVVVEQVPDGARMIVYCNKEELLDYVINATG